MKQKQPFADVLRWFLFFEKNCKPLSPANLLKKDPQQRCFAVNIAKFLRTALFIEHHWWLRLVQNNFRKIETNADIPFSLLQKCTDGIV